MLVSAGSWFMFPQSWISFGVLHGIAVMLLLLRLGLSRLPALALLALAAAALAAPTLLQSPVFDTRWTNWVGLV
ncbi:heparan-alpha-glucosaminide N-acetyltransferase domain-containing protein, partial [Acinetobacter baumannii]